MEGVEIFGLAEDPVEAGLQEADLIHELDGLLLPLLWSRAARARSRCLRWRDRAEAETPYRAARGRREYPAIRAWSISVREAWLQTVQRRSMGFTSGVRGQGFSSQ